MNRKILVLTLCSAVFFSCEKDDDNEDCTITQSPSGSGGGSEIETFEYVNSIGSFWVYQWYRIDSNGDAQQTSRRDSIFIEGDTIIDGQEYAVQNGALFFGAQDYSFYRDSSGYILNEWGSTAWTYVNFGDTLAQNDVSPEWSAYSIMLEAQDINTPSGTFSAVRKQDRFYRQDGELATSCGDEEIVFTTNYASGVGLVQYQFGYISPISINCEFIEEARLVDYYIAL